MAIGIGTLALCALLLIDSETTLLMLFLIGAGYVLALVYLVLIIYLFVRMLRRRDVWLLYFLGISAIFVTFISWLLSAGIIDHHEIAKLFIFGGIPYTLLSITIGITMLRGVSRSKSARYDIA
jgi:hypothetical protein